MVLRQVRQFWTARRRLAMSALGHKRTYAPQQVMSALPPIATAKADMTGAARKDPRSRRARFSGARHRPRSPSRDLSHTLPRVGFLVRMGVCFSGLILVGRYVTWQAVLEG